MRMALCSKLQLIGTEVEIRKESSSRCFKTPNPLLRAGPAASWHARPAHALLASLYEGSRREDGFIVGSIQQSKACKGMRGGAQDRAATCPAGERGGGGSRSRGERRGHSHRPKQASRAKRLQTRKGFGSRAKHTTSQVWAKDCKRSLTSKDPKGTLVGGRTWAKRRAHSSHRSVQKARPLHDTHAGQ